MMSTSPFNSQSGPSSQLFSSDRAPNPSWNTYKAGHVPHSSRHMSEVENEKTVIIKLIARNADTRPASARRDIGVVNSYIRSPILHADETAILRRSLV